MEPQDRARHVAYYAGMRPFLFPALPSEDLTDKPVAIELSGEWFALARLEGEAVLGAKTTGKGRTSDGGA
jgi:hypothetical protein